MMAGENFETADNKGEKAGLGGKLDDLRELTLEKLEADENYKLLLEGGKTELRRRYGGEVLKKIAEGKRFCLPLEEKFKFDLLVSNDPQVSSEAFRVKYIELTKKMVDRILGSGINDVIFLDKSARPVSWLVREFWDLFANGAPMPDFKYVNIDKGAWNFTVGTNEEVTEDSNVSSVIDVRRAPVAILKLRGIFSDKDGKSCFDGKNILVVDEVRSSGDTLEIARQFFKYAFPRATVDSTYWMRPGTIVGKDGVKRNKESPIWYISDSPDGRGVGDPVTAGEFLSTVQENTILKQKS